MVKTNKDRLLEIAVVGVVVHGSSGFSGHGPSVNPVLITKDGRLDVELVKRANIADFWSLT
jgi:hypothetical protein